MKKVYKELLDTQRERGVMFSSELSAKEDGCWTNTVHEITHAEALDNAWEAKKKKDRLLDDSFFDGSPFKFNIIRF